MDLGFRGDFEFLGRHYESQPFEIAWANDINEAACRTYAKHFGPNIICGDVYEALESAPDHADVVIGGFPCQDISVNGKGRGIEGPKSSLYAAMVEAVARIQPSMFVAENVRGLLMKHNREFLKRVLEDFSALGYTITYKLYMAADYGVPQTRERVMIVGTKGGLPGFNHPEPPLDEAEWITAKEAIDDLAALDRDEDFNHIWSLAKRSPEQGGRRLQSDRSGYTLRAECHGNTHFHYKLPRRISMREAARIQSFPDWFTFESKLRETERQVGNAVPPVLAWHVARAVADTLAKADAD